MASNSSRRTYAQKTLTEGLVAIPTGLTAITALDAVIFQVVLVNNTAGAVTVLVQDQQSTPGILIPTISVAANSAEVVPFPEGVKMTSGIKWQAGATGLFGEIFGFVKSA